MFTNGLNLGLPLQAWVSGKEKVPGAAFNKEGHTDNLLEHEKTHLHGFP